MKSNWPPFPLAKLLYWKVLGDTPPGLRSPPIARKIPLEERQAPRLGRRACSFSWIRLNPEFPGWQSGQDSAAGQVAAEPGFRFGRFSNFTIFSILPRCQPCRGFILVLFQWRMLRAAALSTSTKSSKLSASPAGMPLIDKSVATGSPLSHGDILRGLLLGDALLNQVSESRIAGSRIFQRRERLPAKLWANP